MKYLGEHRAMLREEVVKISANESIADQRLADAFRAFHCLSAADADHTDGDRALHHGMSSAIGHIGFQDYSINATHSWRRKKQASHETGNF